VAANPDEISTPSVATSESHVLELTRQRAGVLAANDTATTLPLCVISGEHKIQTEKTRNDWFLPNGVLAIFMLLVASVDMISSCRNRFFLFYSLFFNFLAISAKH
jgi:hypothetical protein